MKSEKKDYEQF